MVFYKHTTFLKRLFMSRFGRAKDKTVCDECGGGWICDECTTTCEACQRTMCDPCIREGRECGCHECMVCEAFIPAERQTRCEWCGAAICDACAKTMEVITCGNEGCAIQHEQQTCVHSSTKPVVNQTYFTCDKCGKTVDL